MKFSKNQIVIGSIVLLAIIIAAVSYFAFFSIKKEDSKSASSTTSKQTKQETKSESNFTSLKGDDFDEAYLADMLAHHEGAVNMAEQAQAVTSHEEIRVLAGDITTSQSHEMIKMQQWQKDWGYKATMGGGHMSHGGKGMEMGGDMVEMMNKLKGLEGDSYDKEFLTQMILHHQQAVDMSEFASTNANHQEIKDLAKNIINAQAKEIAEMKQWQENWGY